MLARYLVGMTAGIASMMWGAYLEGAQMHAFIQPIALLMVGGIFAGLMLTAYSPQQMVQAMQAALNEKRPQTLSEMKHARSLFVRAGRLSLASGLISALVALVFLLRHFNDSPSIGQWIATGVMSLFYGNALYLFFSIPMGVAVDLRIAGHRTRTLSVSRMVRFGLALCLGIGTTMLSLYLDGVTWRQMGWTSSAFLLAAAPVSILFMGGRTSYRLKLSALGAGFMAAGVMGAIIGLVHVMQNLAEFEMIWDGLAVAAMQPVMGLILFIFFSQFVPQRRGGKIILPQAGMALMIIALMMGLTFGALSWTNDGRTEKTSVETISHLPE